MISAGEAETINSTFEGTVGKALALLCAEHDYVDDSPELREHSTGFATRALAYTRILKDDCAPKMPRGHSREKGEIRVKDESLRETATIDLRR